GVLARIYPLPQGTTLSNAVPIEPAGTDRDERDTAALLTNLAKAMTALPGGEQGDGEPKPVTERVRLSASQATTEAARLGFTRQVFGAFMDAQAALAKLGQAAMSPPAERPFRISLHFSDQDVQTVIENGPSGFGLLAIGDQTQQGDLTMVGCRFLGQ